MTNGIMSRGRSDTFSSEFRKLPAAGLRMETSSASLDVHVVIQVPEENHITH